MVELDEETTTLAKGALWQNAANIFVKLLAFVYTIIIARFVAQEQVGLFYFALGIVGTIGIFADFGLTSAVIRYVPYYLGKKDTRNAHLMVNLVVFGGTFLLLAWSLLTFVFAGQIAQFFSNPELKGMLQLFAVYLAVIQSSSIINSLLFSMKGVREVALGGTMQAFLKLIFTILLIFLLGANADSLAIAFIASYAFSAFYLLWELRKHISWLKESISFGISEYARLLKEVLPFGIMVLGVMAISTLIGYSDRLMLGYMLKGDNANEQIAIYSLSTGLAVLAVMFSTPLTNIFYPIVSELIGKEEGNKIKDWKRVNKHAQLAFKWLLFSTVPLAAFLIAFSAPMLRILYGAQYEAGYIAMSLFTIGTLINHMGVVQRTALAGMKLMKINLLSVTVSAIANIVLNYLLIPPFGINGSAFASLVSLFVLTCMDQYFATKYFGFAFPLSAWKNILAGAIVFCLLLSIEAVAYPFITNLPLSFADGLLFGVLDKLLKLAVLLVFFAAGSLFYLALINLMRLFEHEDVQVFRRILSKFGFPAWTTTFFVRLVFWNQKELH